MSWYLASVHAYHANESILYLKHRADNNHPDHKLLNLTVPFSLQLTIPQTPFLTHDRVWSIISIMDMALPSPNPSLHSATSTIAVMQIQYSYNWQTRSSKCALNTECRINKWGALGYWKRKENTPVMSSICQHAMHVLVDCDCQQDSLWTKTLNNRTSDLNFIGLVACKTIYQFKHFQNAFYYFNTRTLERLEIECQDWNTNTS